jgi:N6-adenosine-specific RNA methylase IME4
MERIAPGAVALDCWASVSRGYSAEARPAAAPFSRARVYQPAAPPPPDGADAPRARKRRRREPDAQRLLREGEANARHAAAEPALQAALDALERWLRARGAATLRAALGVAAPDEQEEPDAGGDAPAPAWAQLGALRTAARPKFAWADDADAGADAERDLYDALIENAAAAPRWAAAFGHAVLLPPRCAFLMGDLRGLRPAALRAAALGGGAAAAGEGFHLLLLDPPWENRSARRAELAGGAYAALPGRALLSVPVRALAHAAGCLVALWVTNSERLLRCVHDELLPAWGLEARAAWRWLKVTDAGAPVSPLAVAHRRPYELLLLCSAAGAPPPWAAPGSGFAAPEDGLVLLAPPGAHSRKPPLGALLAPLLPRGARRLELFARECRAGWATWGNEVLKFQGAEHFAAAAAGGRDGAGTSVLRAAL